MRLKGRQGRFLAVTIGGWIAVRVWLLWPVAPDAIGAAVTTPPIGGWAQPHFVAEPPFVPRHASPADMSPDRPDPGASAEDRPRPPSSAARGTGEDRPARPTDGGFATAVQRPIRDIVGPGRMPSPPPPARAVPMPGGRRVEGQAYLFLRPGSGRAALAPGGSLGGSQAAARIAIALARSGPMQIAVAARLYAPLQTRGAEAAVGLDWHPLAGVPLRISVERRIGLDSAGRNAWSAYAAGGFYAGHLPLGLEADGYAQSGVVGLRSRDLFADGAVRLGRRIAVRKAEAVVGVGTWGAAQPGASRLDMGPRVALTLPVDRHSLTLAVEGRLRVAGHAAPGSGAALTLAADF